MNPIVELIFDSGCPNVPAARQSIREALLRAGLPAQWKEWERGSAGTPERLGGFGSPTVLVGGVDVGGEPPSGAACCRVYRAAGGRLVGAPPTEMVSRALPRAGSRAPVRSIP